MNWSRGGVASSSSSTGGFGDCTGALDDSSIDARRRAAASLMRRALASSAWIAAGEPPRERRRGRRAGAHALGEREAGRQVDHVVLAEVDEREAEQQRVGPPQRPGDHAGLGEHMRRRDGCREVQGGHGGQGVPPEDTVQRGPAGPPEVLAVLDHHAPQLRRAPVVHVALGRRVPGRRGRHRPVAEQPDVERRVDAGGAALEALGVAEDQVQHGAVREREPEPVRPDQQLLPRLEAAGRAERPLEPQGRRDAAAEEAVGLDRVGDLDAPAERLGVVVGHLVRRHVGVHLQQARPDVTRARARDEHAQRRRGGRGGADHHRRLQAQAAADERSRHSGGQHRQGGRADGGRAAHGGRM